MNHFAQKLTSVLTWVALLLLVAAVRAEDIYVAQTAIGGATGADASNAHSTTWFNASANWGSGAGKISAGDTVHLVGTIASALTVQASGSAGSPITILFESGSKISAAYWDESTGAIRINAKNYITIDGGTNGLIEATNNGTTKTYQVNSVGVYGTGTDHLTVKNLTVTNMYDRTAFSQTDANRLGYAIVVDGLNTNLLIQNNTLSSGDALVSLGFSTGTSSAWTISGNTLSNTNHAINIGCSGSAVNAYVTDCTISNNTIDHLDYWGPYSGNHLDGIIIFNESSDNSGAFTNLYIYGNTVGPHIGTINTAAIFLLGYVNAQMVNVRIYNNLLTQILPYSWSNGFIRIYGCTNSFVVNNTCVAYDTGGAGTSTGIGLSLGMGGVQPVNLTHKNNLYYSVGTPVCFGAGTVRPTGFVSEYNIYYDIGSTNSFYGPSWGAGNWSYWQGQGYDSNSTRSQPTLDSNYKPTAADTVARDAGTNLSTYFATDKSGVSRPKGPEWDIGAYEYDPGVATPAITSTLSATATVGSSFSYTITATNSPTSFSASPLPAGLSVDTSTGVISGTPTAIGATSTTIGATNASDTGTALLALAPSAAHIDITVH